MQLPSDIRYGYVYGRYLLAVADTSADPDRNPDGVPAVGTVKFTPKAVNLISQVTPPTTIIPQPIIGTIDTDGVVRDPTGSVGVWLVTGHYSVSFSFPGVTLPAFEITVSDFHTEDEPLHLTDAAPITPTPERIFVVNHQVYQDTLNRAEDADEAALAAAASEQIAVASAATASSAANTATTASGEAVSAAAQAKSDRTLTGQYKDQTLAARDEAVIAVPSAYADWTGTVTKTAAAVAGPGYEKVRLTGATVLVLPNGATGLAYSRRLKIKQDATGGRALTIRNARTQYGLVIPLTATANAVDVVDIEWDGEAWTATLAASNLTVPTAWAA